MSNLPDRKIADHGAATENLPVVEKNKGTQEMTRGAEKPAAPSGG